MRTELIDADQPGAIERAAKLLSRGLLVAFPTDTLYGLGADTFNEMAVGILYRAKERSMNKGIPILLDSTNSLNLVVDHVPTIARYLIDRYWPGPITLILPKNENLPASISPNANIAVRIPDNHVARRFIKAAGGAVATSSANLSGDQPALDAESALEALQGRVAAVLDGGSVRHGLASTIVDCTSSPPRLLREGPISLAEVPPEVIKQP